MYEEYTKNLNDIQRLIDFAHENNMGIDSLILSLELLKTMRLHDNQQASNDLIKESDDLLKKILGDIKF